MLSRLSVVGKSHTHAPRVQSHPKSHPESHPKPKPQTDPLKPSGEPITLRKSGKKKHAPIVPSASTQKTPNTNTTNHKTQKSWERNFGSRTKESPIPPAPSSRALELRGQKHYRTIRTTINSTRRMIPAKEIHTSYNMCATATALLLQVAN